MELLIVLLIGAALLGVGYYAVHRAAKRREEEAETATTHTVGAETLNFPQHIVLTQPKKVHTGEPFVVHYQPHSKARRHILRHPGGGYYIEDMGMDCGVDLSDLIMLGYCVYQDVLDFQAEQEALGSPVDFDTAEYLLNAPDAPNPPVAPFPTGTADDWALPDTKTPDWGDSHVSVPEPSRWSTPEPVYSAPEPHRYEAPSHYETPSHSDWGSSSSSSSSDYSSSSSSSDCGDGGGGGGD